MKVTLSAFALVIGSTSAVAQQCESLISLSKLSSTTIADKSAVEQHASNFCSEYSKSGGKSSSSSFGASYKFLSLSSANADTSVEAIASKYCSASSNFSQSSDAYKQYVDSIAPGAFEAYQQCIQLASRDVRFSLSAASTLPSEFSMTVSFTGSGAANKSAEISANPASGISCTWDSKTRPSVVLGTGQTTVLQCKRQEINRRGYVVVARTDGTKESMTIPWQAYSKDGVPIDALSAFESRVRKLENDLAASVANYGVQQGTLANITNRTTTLETATAVVVARTNNCPAGWRQISNLLVGINPESTAQAQGSGITLAKTSVGPWPGAHPSICVRN